MNVYLGLKVGLTFSSAIPAAASACSSRFRCAARWSCTATSRTAIDQFLKHSTKSLCLPPLAVGMGIYLPPVVQTPLVVGAVLGYFLRKHLRAQGGEEAEVAGNRRGTLFASGLIVGESIIGVLLAGVIVVSVTNGGSDAPLALVGKDFADTAEYLGLAVFAASLVIFSKIVLGGSKK